MLESDFSQSQEKLKQLWPKYYPQINKFIQKDTSYYHKLMARLLLLCHPKNTVELIIDHDLGGGTTDYRNRKVNALVEKKRTVIYLYPSRKHKKNYEITVLNWKDKLSFQARSFKKTMDLFTILNIKIVHLNSLVDYSGCQNKLSLINSFVQKCRCSLDILLHDFYPLCPSYNLINYKESFCALPAFNKCQKCFKRLKQNKSDELSINKWRENWISLMKTASNIIVFSNSSKTIFNQVYPSFAQKLLVKSHSLSYFKHGKLTLNAKNEQLKIGVLGNINHQKGLAKIASLGKFFKAKKTKHEIIILGKVSKIQKLPSNIHVQGSYTIENLPSIIKEHNINVFFMPSIWPETFSYVTEELILLDVPIVGFAIGAQGEKIKKYSKGKTIRLTSSNQKIIEALQSL